MTKQALEVVLNTIIKETNQILEQDSITGM